MEEEIEDKQHQKPIKVLGNHKFPPLWIKKIHP